MRMNTHLCMRIRISQRIEVDTYEYASMRTNKHSVKTQVDAYEYASMRANTHFAKNQKPAKKEDPKMPIEANVM